jgi:putative flavoprotein involved in K+ transport
LRAHSSGFELDMSEGPLLATNVVMATGPYHLSRLPHIHRDLSARLLQLHASEYRSHTALPEGAVLVVGSGASGCQIADELMESGRRVLLSVGHHRVLVATRAR